MNITEWLDVCPLSVYSVQSDILHEVKRRENTRLNTHRYLLLQGGTMRFQSADSSFTLHPGDVLFTPSGYHYSYLLSEDARYTNVFFFLHPPEEPIPDSAPFFTDCLYIEKRADFVKMIEKALREETEHPRGYHVMQKALVRELLIETHRVFSGEPAAHFRPQIDAILAYIQLHITEPLPRERLQAEFHFHPNYINRLIRRATGMSLHQYIAETRIQKAKDLLTSSAMPIGEIAQSLCFYDSSHFSATFQKHTGVTPSFFRGSF